MATKITKNRKAAHPAHPSKVPYRPRVVLTRGDAVRITRELQEMTQVELAAAAGMPQATISAIECGKITLGDKRAEPLARALKVHPGVLLWPQWDEQGEVKAG
jgi:transcriptional regulator with XRE-family HTH domain